MSLTRVLCVDDEPLVLEGLRLHLRRGYEVETATSGREGLEAIASRGPFAVVMSDMRMPGMDGATFLGQVRSIAPDTVRILLTGHAELDSAIAAVNEGQIFRFLNKPCSPQYLRGAIDAAAEQHRLVQAERVLLEQTLRGAIKTLTDVLSLASPLAFGRAERIRQLVCVLADELKVPNRWQLEVAAMLSQLGCVTLPDETIRKQHQGEPLSPEEQAMLARVPEVSAGLLANIPRMEPVRELLTRYLAPAGRAISRDPSERGEAALAAAILRVAVDFDELESQLKSAQRAMGVIRSREGVYDLSVLQVFIRSRGLADSQRELRELPLKALGVGMVLAEDVRTTSGLLLVARGFQVTSSFLEKARNFRPGYVHEPVRVVVSGEQT